MQKLRIATYNVWAVKMGPIHISPGIQQRMTAIREWMATWDADVVCLQEVWCESLVCQLHDANIFPYMARLGSHRPFKGRFGDGLLTLSRFPIVESTAVTFRHFTSFEEFWVAKGAMASTVHTPDGPVNVINTHLGAGNKNNHVRSRFAQIEELVRFVEAASRVGPALLAGDLNLTPNSADYAWLHHLLRRSSEWSDLGLQHNRSSFHPFRSYGWKKKSDRSTRIDYVFQKLATSLSTVIRPVMEYPLSDHSPVIADAIFDTSAAKLPAVA